MERITKMTRGEKVCACRYIRPWWIANIRKEQEHFQMNIETVKELLIENEGMVLHCYKDHLGLDPIGVGRLIHEGKGGLTEEEAKYLLENDIGRVIDRLDRNFPWWRDLSEKRQHVMIDLSFNLGNRLSKFVKFLSSLEAGDNAAASEHLFDSKYARQVTNRANRNAEVIRER